MKDKLEVGMYVRTKWGYICKLININDFREPSMRYGIEANYLRDVMFIGDEDILKASHNIIDLIEVGDYVNGYKVRGTSVSTLLLDNFNMIKIEDYEIKSIVTKEMFSSVEYRMETD